MQCLANIDMILLGIRDREMRMPRDLNRATLGQFGEWRYPDTEGDD